MTEYVKKGSDLDYVGAFNPTTQTGGDISDWQTCGQYLNLLQVSHANMGETYAGQIVGFENEYESRIALMWDVRYAYHVADSPKVSSTTTLLVNAMDYIKEAIDDLGINNDRKHDLWAQMMWGGWIVDEPVSRRYRSGGNDNWAAERDPTSISEKCEALNGAFDHYTQYPWTLGDPKRLAVFHRQNNAAQASWNYDWADCDYFDDPGDDCFEDNASGWHDSGDGINQWGMDSYLYSNSDDDTMIKNDRDFFFEYLTDCSIESEDSKFMVMVGRAFSEPPTYNTGDGWLDYTRMKYYYDCAVDYDSSKSLYWKNQFSALLWYAYETDALGSGVTGYIDESDVYDDVQCLSEDNW